MNSQVKDVGMVAVAIAMVVVAVMGFMRLDKYIKSVAVADCGKIYTFTTESTGTGPDGVPMRTTRVETIRDLYQLCMQDKGYTTVMAE